MPIEIKPTNLRNLKELFLVLSVIYFYGLGTALQFGFPTLGLERPAIFVAMSVLFLSALVLESILGWWNKRHAALWFVLAVLSYGILGFIVAPLFYGPDILVYVYLEPVVIVFVGGFAFSFGRILAETYLKERALTAEEIARQLRDIPGWESTREGIQKTFRFSTETASVSFESRITESARSNGKHPIIRRATDGMVVLIQHRDAGGVAASDLRFAKAVDRLA